MPIIEVVGSRATTVSIDNPSKEVLFLVTGYFNEEVVRAYVEHELPPFIMMPSALFRQPRKLVLQNYTIRQREVGGPYWDGTAMYGRRQPRQTGDLVFSFDSTGGTEHITVSKETVEKYGSTYALAVLGQPPDFSGAIGVNGDSVDGCDIVVPVFKVTADWYPPVEFVTNEQILKWVGLTGKVNWSPWRGFDTGEVLFLGVTGGQRSLDDWEIKFHFIISPNVVYDANNPSEKPGLTVGNIEHITKNGHEFLWVRFREAEDGSNLVKRPAYAYTERVYEFGDFEQLGIPSDGEPLDLWQQIQGTAPNTPPEV